jgi:TolB protein
MMKKLLLLLSICAICTLPPVSEAAGRRIVFTRWHTYSNYVWTAELNGSGRSTVKQKHVADGYDPEISPDGHKIACTYYQNTKGAADRYIAIFDIASKKRKIIRNIPSRNSFGPHWSPDNRRLAFGTFIDNSSWRLVVYDTRTSKYKIIKPQKSDLFAPFWSQNGKYVYAQDLDNVYKFSADGGRLLESVPFSSIIKGKKIYTDSATQFSISPNGRKWLFCAQTGSEPLCKRCRVEKYEPPLKNAAFIYDTATGRLTRAIPPQWCVWNAAWFGDSILFTGHRTDSSRKSPIKNIYIMNHDSKPALIVRNGGEVSVSH